jgi:hypothetical protein
MLRTDEMARGASSLCANANAASSLSSLLEHHIDGIHMVVME